MLKFLTSPSPSPYTSAICVPVCLRLCLTGACAEWLHEHGARLVATDRSLWNRRAQDWKATHTHTPLAAGCVFGYKLTSEERERERDRQTERQTERERERLRDRGERKRVGEGRN